MVQGETLVAFDLRALPPEADRAGAGARKQQSYREIGRVGTKRDMVGGVREKGTNASATVD